jgi:hypothetical protein
MERLYIARGDGGLFKVGRTRDWETRLYRLRYQFRDRGESLVVAHAFVDEVKSAHDAEFTMLRVISNVGHKPVEGREWFRDVDFRWAHVVGALVITHAKAGHLFFSMVGHVTPEATLLAARMRDAPRKAGLPPAASRSTARAPGAR